MGKKSFTIYAEVDCEGMYGVEAESEEEALEIFKNWDGGDSVAFHGYTQESVATKPTRIDED